MKRIIISILFTIPFLVACSQQAEEDDSRNTLSGAGGYADDDAVIQSADGSLYSVGCMQENASAISQRGAVALTACQVSLNSSGSIDSSVEGRGKFLTNSYAYVYYPPTYYNPYYSGYSYGSNYSWNSDNRFKNDLFCGWIFGSSNNSGLNCYYLFGYTNYNYSNYSNYYNSSCSSCIYSYNPSYCQSRCYSQVPVYYY